MYDSAPDVDGAEDDDASHGELSLHDVRPDTTSAAAGVVSGARAFGRMRQARDVSETLARLRRRPDRVEFGPWLREVAAATRVSTGPYGKSGSLGQLRGHLFERMDVRSFNLHNARREVELQLRSSPHSPGYDASRFVRGRFAGGVQHKLGPGGVRKAAAKLEATKAGSASRATVRVPGDRVAEAIRNAGGTIRVEGSEVTSAAVARQAEVGLREVARHGERAVSGLGQAALAARRSAVGAVIVGGALEAGRLRRHEVSAAEFMVGRCVDAAEAALASATTAGVLSAVVAVAEGVALAGGVGAGAAAAVASSSVVVPAAAVVTVGVVVSRAGRPVRRRVERRVRPSRPAKLTPEAS